MTDPLACALPNTCPPEFGFDPVSWWLEQHGETAEDASRSLSFLCDGRQFLIRSNSDRAIEHLRQKLVRYFPSPAPGSGGADYEIEIHVMDKVSGGKIDLPDRSTWGRGGVAGFQAPLEAISSRHFLHLRWKGVEAFSRPNNLLVSLAITSTVRIRLLTAGLERYAKRGNLRYLEIDASAASEGEDPSMAAFPAAPVNSITIDELEEVVRNMTIRALGYFCLHAATVCRGDRGALLMGPSGSGKTTTALALLRGGYRLLSDETSLLDASGTHPRLAGFASAPRLYLGGLAELTHLEETLGEHTGRKSEVRSWAGDSQPADLRWVRPAALIFLRIHPSQEEHSIVPIPPNEAFVRLTNQILDPTNVFRKVAQAKATAALVEECTAYELTPSRRLDQLPEIVGRLMGGVS